jgi:phage terminase large subunit GpA-like protein
VHRGQEVAPDGAIVGEAVQTQTFGLRWSAIDNPFATASQIGVEEWRSARAANRDNSERKMRQFVWCLPYEPPDVDLTPLDPEAIANRSENDKRGVPPSDTIAVAVGIDTGKRKLHWTAIAIRASGGAAVIEYGTQTVNADQLGITKALHEAFTQVEAYFAEGWTGATGQSWSPAQVWIDSGWHEHTNAVYAFCAAANEGLDPGKEQYRPAKGFGEGQMLVGRYVAPTKRSRDVLFLGHGYHLARLRRNGRLMPGVIIAHVDSDAWKSQLHDRLAMPADQPEAVTLYRSADSFEHTEFAAHLTAEKQVETFVPGRGAVRKWERISRNNHYLDATYNGLAAGEFARTLQLLAKPKDGTWFEKEKTRP